MPDSELIAAQTVTGAELVDAEGGPPVVAHFGDPKTEYAAAQQRAALFDLSDRSQIELGGKDRQSFLHNYCTNEIASLQPGQGCEAFMTNAKGRILAHIFVFADVNSVWVESVPHAAEPFISHLDRYCITEDVTFDDRTSQYGELLVAGPSAADELNQIAPEAESLTPYGHVCRTYQGDALAVRRVDWLGLPGFLLSVPRRQLARL